MSSNGYIFTSRKQVLARIASEPSYAVEAVRLIDERNGWMASHRSRASKLVARLAAGSRSAEDLAEAVALAVPYARTLSRLAREKEIAARPELMGVAALFGVVRPVVQAEVATAPVALAPVATASTEPASVPKRRGRPKGSRNKPKEEAAPKRRRRS
jgi:hypothetical protein